MDGFLVGTTGQCKRGMDIAYDGTWGYHVLVLTLANTGEVMSIVNRSGNRPSHEGAAALVDRTLPVCFRGGFRRVLLRGDSKFSQSEHLDRWDDDARVRFIFGFEASPNLKAIAEALPTCAWRPLQRPARYVESAAADLLPPGGRVAVLTRASLKSQSGRSDPPTAPKATLQKRVWVIRTLKWGTPYCSSQSRTEKVRPRRHGFRSPPSSESSLV